eukprot:5015036-Pyramimonas_sp.AAC.1
MGGCDLRNGRHFRRPLGGPAERRLTLIQNRLRHPWGGAICEIVATSEGCWWVQRSDVLRKSDLTSPSLGGV